jgi:membrane protease YdiL (CAAX protease family)
VSECGPDEFCTVAGVTDAMMLDAVPPPAATTEPPREYPQALRGPRHRWWRPLLGLGVMVAGLAVVTGALLLCVLVFVIAESMGAELPDPASDAFLVSPAGMFFTNLGLALGIPLALAATWAQAGRAGLVSSVLGRVRWRLLLGGLGLALLLLVPLTVGMDVLLTQLGFPAGGDAGAGSSADETGPWPLTPASGWIALSIVILLTTPLQAAGEEYFFRGWLSQWIGSWLRWRWLAVVIPAVVTGLLFALAHGAQSPWLFADRLVFGLLASLLAWRTGGLEIAVAMHAANNLLAFGLAIAYDQLAESLLITEVPPLDGAVSIAITILTGAVLLLWARRHDPDLVVTDPVLPEPIRPEPGTAEAGPANGETT